MTLGTNEQWCLKSEPCGFDSLVLKEGSVPALGESDVLVRWKYAALNYRELMIAKGTYPLGATEGVVLGTDGAGEVVSVGSEVGMFKVGDRVTATHAQTYLSGDLDMKDMGSTLGNRIDGVLQNYGVLRETGLVKVPQNLDLQQGSTLGVAGVTAWNALFGLSGKSVKAGQWILVQGSGGVSVFALQFAKASGAHVIATSSSEEKLQALRDLGADHVINYKTTPNWGEEAKRITGGTGVDHIIEVGGPGTLRQSLKAIRLNGAIDLIGFLAPDEKDGGPGLMEALVSMCILRGVLCGSREQFLEMNAFIEAHGIEPVVDQKTFDFSEVKAAYQYLWDQKHVGKVTIKIS